MLNAIRQCSTKELPPIIVFHVLLQCVFLYIIESFRRIYGIIFIKFIQYTFADSHRAAWFKVFSFLEIYISKYFLFNATGTPGKKI